MNISFSFNGIGCAYIFEKKIINSFKNTQQLIYVGKQTAGKWGIKINKIKWSSREITSAVVYLLLTSDRLCVPHFTDQICLSAY